MERKESSRHLAAILFTDIVGYTAMMQRWPVIPCEKKVIEEYRK